jgi:hypothetical protein
VDVVKRHHEGLLQALGDDIDLALPHPDGADVATSRPARRLLMRSWTPSGDVNRDARVAVRLWIDLSCRDSALVNPGIAAIAHAATATWHALHVRHDRWTYGLAMVARVATHLCEAVAPRYRRDGTIVPSLDATDDRFTPTVHTLQRVLVQAMGVMEHHRTHTPLYNHRETAWVCAQSYPDATTARALFVAADGRYCDDIDPRVKAERVRVLRNDICSTALHQGMDVDGWT